jgi:oxygen-independent coproporphyrinogen-3 oxidase
MPVTQEHEVSWLIYAPEFMLNALWLREGSSCRILRKTGLPFTAIQKGLDEAERKGLIERDLCTSVPTELVLIS